MAKMLKSDKYRKSRGGWTDVSSNIVQHGQLAKFDFYSIVSLQRRRTVMCPWCDDPECRWDGCILAQTPKEREETPPPVEELRQEP